MFRTFWSVAAEVVPRCPWSSAGSRLHSAFDDLNEGFAEAAEEAAKLERTVTEAFSPKAGEGLQRRASTFGDFSALSLSVFSPSKKDDSDKESESPDARSGQPKTAWTPRSRFCLISREVCPLSSSGMARSTATSFPQARTRPSP